MRATNTKTNKQKKQCNQRVGEGAVWHTPEQAWINTNIYVP